jgi:polysaccharide pyruvyl transferase WcaK-like protein
MNIPLDAKARVHQQIAEVLAFLKGEGYRNVRLLCHDHRDIPFAASLGDVDYVYADDIYVFLALLRSASLVVTYRLHAALPCLAFGTPVIKVSYDERALSLLETVGFGRWNIDLVQSPDVVGEIIDRHRRLTELEELRRQAQPIWDHLYATMREAFCRFAEEAERQHAADRNEFAPRLRKSA